MDVKKKILIISYHFPPLNTMEAKRYGIMCKYLEQYGYIPYVITARAKGGGYINSKLDLEVPINEEHIIRIGAVGVLHPIYNMRQELLCDYMSRNKLSSRVINELAIGWYEKVKRELDLNKLRDIDIILGTFPSSANLLLGKYLAKKLRKPYITEIRDLISDYNETAFGKKRLKFLDRFMEWRLLKDAAGVVTVTDGFRNILKKRYPKKKIVTVYNGWDSECEELTDLKPEKKYLYYAGSLYEHRIESLTVLLQVIAQITSEQNVQLRIRSVGPEELDRKVESIIRQMRLEHAVQLLPAASEAVIKMEQKRAYINVVLSSVHQEDRALMTTIPGKLLELLRMDAPVLAIVPKMSDIGKILTDTNKGIATVNKEEIIDFILNTNSSYTGNSKVNFFSRKHQARRLCRFMDHILK